ncbi:T7SS effector LXG polymorphic toxin [Enterococcus sp. LJL51]|uniref:T7SS effector LXG polymorphic toxin n=1 Tax=Enterococcus sp. LJL51 TaxID=3416656 RepID=UPI003CF81093
MGLSFFVGEIEAQTNEAIQIANEHRQNAGILKDAINAYLRAPLSGKTYDSARNYFGEVYPPIASGMTLVAESMIEAHTKFPAKFQEIVGGGDIEEDRLREQIQEGQNILRAYADVLNKEEKPNLRMERAYMRMQEGIAVLEERLQKLYEFNSVSADIFTEALTNIENLNRGVDALEKGGAWHAASGTFDITKLDMTWVKPIQEKWQEREQNYGKGLQLEVKVGKNSLGGTKYDVYSNGIYDEDATIVYNELLRIEMTELLRQRVAEDKFSQFVSFIGTMITFSGGIKKIISEIVGAVGNRLLVRFNDNTYGTVAISGGVAIEGNAVLADSLTLKDFVQFSNNGKITSKTFGKPIEGRVEGKKSKIRVDAEPDGGKIQVQTGHGKRSPLDFRLEIEEITDRTSIYNQIPRNIKRGIGKGKLDELVDNIYRAWVWLKTK